MKYSLDILEDYIGKGMVIKQTHPTLPLSIYNYSRTCQFGRYWDDITLNCRGLILDNEGNVIAKSFQKFFNMEELGPHQTPNDATFITDHTGPSLFSKYYVYGLGRVCRWSEGHRRIEKIYQELKTKN